MWGFKAKTQQAQGSGLFNRSWCAALRPMFVRALLSAPAHAGFSWQETRLMAIPSPLAGLAISIGRATPGETCMTRIQGQEFDEAELVPKDLYCRKLERCPV